VADGTFESDRVFGEDYLYFFAEALEERADADVDLIWRVLGLEPGMEVLDMGCGHGRLANRLAQRGCHVTGLDTVPLFLDRAREDAAARRVTVTYELGDMRSLPWDRRFDRVLNWGNSFGFFDDDAGNRRVLREAARVLAPGGRFALEHYNRDALARTLRPAAVLDRARRPGPPGPVLHPGVHLHRAAGLAARRGLLSRDRVRRGRRATHHGRPANDRRRPELTRRSPGRRDGRPAR
jgi:SAM-dependent methyltransferase